MLNDRFVVKKVQRHPIVCVLFTFHILNNLEPNPNLEVNKKSLRNKISIAKEVVYWERIDATVNGLSRRKSPFARKRLQQFVSSYLFTLTCCGLESPKVLFFQLHLSLSLQVNVKNIIKSYLFWDNKKWFTYRIRKKTFEHFFFLCESDKQLKLVLSSSLVVN